MILFFALAMIESRLVRMFDQLKAEIGKEAFAGIAKDDLYDMIRDEGQGYNIFIFEKSQSLKDICKNDKSFDIDFEAYLNSFDGEAKDLLGVDAEKGEEFLDITGVVAKLKAKDIKNDKTERFKFIPSISDGQLLFMQHLISKLDSVGMGVVVHNGSSLFSGDAGSAESNIRKWMLDSDIVEAVVQLPTDEFFNTGIYTYLWILNKNKQPHHKDKVMLINASTKFKPLKKSKGSKRKEVDEANRLDIVATLTAYQDNDYAKVFDKEFFYFNKQAIQLTNTDEDGNFFAQKLKVDNEQLIIDNDLFTLTVEGNQLSIDNCPLSTNSETANRLKELFKQLNYKEHNLKIHTPEIIYGYDPEKESLTELIVDNSQLITVNSPLSTINYLGCGKIVVKSSLKKATKKLPERIEISVELTPDYQKDYEIIPFHKDEDANQQAIADFMAKYISKPFTYLDNVVGVDLNFNKVFYKPEKLRPVGELLAEIEIIDKQLSELEAELVL